MRNVYASRLDGGLHGASERLIITRTITPEHVLRLLTGQVLAILRPGLYDPEMAARVGKRLLESGALTGYTAGNNAAEVLKIGDSIYECTDEERINGYFRTGAGTSERIRQIVAPDPAPLDVALPHLRAAWPAGVEPLDIDGQSGFAGLIRGFTDGGEGRPHTDRADWDLPESSTFRRLVAQLAVNVYLTKEAGGGQVELWKHLPDEATYKAWRLTGDYSLRREALGPPDLAVDPKVGDLLIFNAWRVHAVRPSKGPRVAQSWFLGVFNPGEPLGIFS